MFNWRDLIELGNVGVGLWGANATSSAQRADGAASMAYGITREAMALQDANQEEDAAKALAEKILRAAHKQKGAARAATAASGVRLDEFAAAPEEEIERLAQEDAAMTILSGKRTADSIRRGGAMARLAGENELAASGTRANTTMFQGAAAAARGIAGWRGTTGSSNAKTVPIYENPEY